MSLRSILSLNKIVLIAILLNSSVLMTIARTVSFDDNDSMENFEADKSVKANDSGLSFLPAGLSDADSNDLDNLPIYAKRGRFLISKKSETNERKPENSNTNTNGNGVLSRTDIIRFCLHRRFDLNEPLFQLCKRSFYYFLH